MTEDSLQEAIKDIIERYDPVGLLKRGYPADQYKHEVKKILPLLRETTSVDSLQEKVHAVFVEMFFEDIAGPKEDYRKLSEEIYGLREQ